MHRMKIGLLGGAACAAFCVTGGAFAQTAPVNQEDGSEIQSADNGLGDIVVTARKRAHGEALQSTPLAISALGAQQLSQQSVKDLVDVGHIVPNASLQSSAQRGIQNFSIRGMGITGSTASDESAVGIIEDGVYWGSSYGALSQLLDLESVEVMRGPQGTLFGRNVTGGAVVIRSARPTNEFYGKASAGVGTYGAVDGSIVGNLPIIDQTLAFRLAAMVQRDNGYLRDTYNGGHFGGTRQTIIRPSFKLTPSSNFDVTVIGEFYRLRGDPVGARGIAPTTIPGHAPTLPTLDGYVTPDYYWAVSPNNPGHGRLDTNSVTVEANWHVLGGVITAVGGYREVKSNVATDYDGTPSDGFFQHTFYNQHQYSGELRYAADLTDWASLTTGFYYFNQKFGWGEWRDLNNHAALLGAGANLKNTSYAGYAEADIKPLYGLTLTLGGRYTHETKDAQSAPFGSCNIDWSVCTFGPWHHYSANKFTPKIGLSYEVEPGKMVYASYTKGFRSGGFPLRGTPLAEPYKAEVANAYEAGFKTDWFDHRLRVNAAFYYNKFSNLQRNVIAVSQSMGVIQSVFNAADAVIKGAEIEATLLVGGGFTLSGNFGLTHARYKSFLGVTDPGRLRLTRVPERTANLAVDYEHEFGNGNKLAANVGAAYTSSYMWDDVNTPTLKTPSVWLINSTISYTINDRYTVAIWGKNLSNRKYAVWGSNLGSLGQNEFPTEPRTMGVRLTAEFK